VTSTYPARIALIAVCASSLVAGAACAQPQPRPAKPPIDPAVVKEQKRRIAAFDSVVRLVNTDSAFQLWHAMLTAPDIRTAQLAMMCENSRLSGINGRAAYVALDRMADTLWKRDDPALVSRMDKRLVGASPAMTSTSCGSPRERTAPKWLREWTVYELPKLPPSPDSIGPR
jgi:hypothetical protein